MRSTLYLIVAVYMGMSGGMSAPAGGVAAGAVGVVRKPCAGRPWPFWGKAG